MEHAVKFFRDLYFQQCYSDFIEEGKDEWVALMEASEREADLPSVVIKIEIVKHIINCKNKNVCNVCDIIRMGDEK